MNVHNKAKTPIQDRQPSFELGERHYHFAFFPAAVFVTAWLACSACVIAKENTPGQWLPLTLTNDIGLQPVGFGSLTWFGFSIYDASLWTRDGTFNYRSNDLSQSLPAALHITYQKEIASTALAERTTQEWKRLDIFSSNQRKAWQQRLVTIWPTVKPGDSITTLVTRDRKTYFYYNHELIAVVDDTTFGTALLSIWLDANTSEPQLRRELIGYKEG